MILLKILVFSDSHRSMGDMIDAVEEQRPDQIIHLGDLLRDAEQLAGLYPQIPVCMVPGNCDGWTDVPAKKLIELRGRRILLSHGHLWGVKSGYESAMAEARRAGADILLFGHTHRAYCQRFPGLWVMNPGSSRSSYGTILLEGDDTLCSLTQLI